MKTKYLIALLFISGCLVSQFFWRGIVVERDSPLSTLPICLAIVGLVVTAIMVAKDPELAIIDSNGQLNSRSLGALVAPLVAAITSCYRRAKVLIWLAIRWINIRDRIAPHSLGNRIKAISGFLVGAGLLVVSAAIYLVEGSLIFRLTVGLVAVFAILALDLLIGGCGWRPQGGSPGGLMNFKRFWPSITRNTRTFLKGFIGGLANTLLYAIAVLGPLFVAYSLREGRKSELDRINERQGIAAPRDWNLPALSTDKDTTLGKPGLLQWPTSSSEVDVDGIVGAMTAEYWRVAVADLHQWRFPQLKPDEQHDAFYHRIETGLSGALEQAKQTGQLFVHEPLVEMAQRHLETDIEALALMSDARELSANQQLDRKALSAEKSVGLGLDTLESLGNGDVSVEDVARSWNLPADIVKRAVLVEVQRVEQLKEIEQMQDSLRSRFPNEDFALPE